MKTESRDLSGAGEEGNMEMYCFVVSFKVMKRF